jgi:hypothetical protein
MSSSSTDYSGNTMRFLVFAFYVFLFPFLMGGPLAAQEADAVAGEDPRFRIASEMDGEILTLMALGWSSTQTDSLTYRMEVARKGSGGVSTSRQGGKFFLSPDEERTLSRSSVNLDENGGCEARLRVYSGETCIADVRKTFTQTTTDGCRENQ